MRRECMAISVGACAEGAARSLAVAVAVAVAIGSALIGLVLAGTTSCTGICVVIAESACSSDSCMREMARERAGGGTRASRVEWDR